MKCETERVKPDTLQPHERILADGQKVNRALKKSVTTKACVTSVMRQLGWLKNDEKS